MGRYKGLTLPEVIIVVVVCFLLASGVFSVLRLQHEQSSASGVDISSSQSHKE